MLILLRNAVKHGSPREKELVGRILIRVPLMSLFVKIVPVVKSIVTFLNAFRSIRESSSGASLVQNAIFSLLSTEYSFRVKGLNLFVYIAGEDARDTRLIRSESTQDSQ